MVLGVPILKHFRVACCRMYRKCYCTTPGIGIGSSVSISVSVGSGSGVGVDNMLKFYLTVFYVMGKALSGELSCLWTDLCFFPTIINFGAVWAK